MANKCPAREDIGDDQPVRLAVAAALAFPDGSMTASGLRREAARGRLVVERIAGKDYTTLANIELMREGSYAASKQRRPSLAAASATGPCGSFVTAASNEALVSARVKLKR